MCVIVNSHGLMHAGLALAGWPDTVNYKDKIRREEGGGKGQGRSTERKQPTNKGTKEYEWVDEEGKRWGKELNEWLNEWTSEWLNEWMSEWVSESVNEWVSEWLSEWVNEWVSEWMNEWTNEWMNEWMNEWKHERLNE